MERTKDGALVTFTVTNTGRRAGAEVAQVYVGAPRSTSEPPKQLKGFKKVFLNPGETTKVTISLDSRAFAHWSADKQTWMIAKGTYNVLVGSSSRDIRGAKGLALGARTLAR